MKVILLLSILISLPLFAEDSITTNGYDIHYNAFPTLAIDNEAAKNYQITRSKKRGMINISVLKQQDKGMPIAVDAEVIVMVKNLYGQDKKFEIRKISENDGAIYYIGTFPITNGELVNFNAYITPSGSTKQTHVKFSREFFTD